MSLPPDFLQLVEQELADDLTLPNFIKEQVMVKARAMCATKVEQPREAIANDSGSRTTH